MFIRNYCDDSSKTLNAEKLDAPIGIFPGDLLLGIMLIISASSLSEIPFISTYYRYYPVLGCELHIYTDYA